MCPGGLECPQSRKLHTLPGHLLLCFATLRVKKFFLMLRGDLLCFTFWLLFLLLLLGTTGRALPILLGMPTPCQTLLSAPGACLDCQQCFC